METIGEARARALPPARSSRSASRSRPSPGGGSGRRRRARSSPGRARSRPGRAWPARSAASRTASIASSLDGRSGAKPPSSPTPVASPRSCRSSFRRWNVSAPIRSASENDEAPAGTTMNSWRSSEFCACAPPLTTFMHRHGEHARVLAAEPAVERHAGLERCRPSRRPATTPRIALAPSRDLFGVPSSSTSSPVDRRPGRAASAPTSAGADLAARRSRPPGGRPCRGRRPGRRRGARPPRTAPSRRPEGTAARPSAPESSPTSTSTVGFPRESRIWRAWTSTIFTRAPPWRACSSDPAPRGRASASRCPSPPASSAARSTRVDEAPARGPQGELRVDVERAREVDAVKSRSPSSATTRAGGSVSGAGAPASSISASSSSDLLPQLRQRAGGVEPVEARRGGPPLHLPRVEERRERLGHVVEDPLPLLLLALQLLPAALDRPGRRRAPRRRRRGDAGGRACRGWRARRRRGRRRRAPRAGARGRPSGRGGRRARRRASRRRRRARRRRPRRPPRRCAGRSSRSVCARSQGHSRRSRSASSLELDERLLEPVAAAHGSSSVGRLVAVPSPVVVSALRRGLEARRVGDLGGEARLELLHPLVDPRVLPLLEERGRDLLLDVGERLASTSASMSPSASMMCQPNCVLIGLGELARLRARRRPCRTARPSRPSAR